MNNPYADIIDLPHHVSKEHPQMAMEKRAAPSLPYLATMRQSMKLLGLRRNGWTFLRTKLP